MYYNFFTDCQFIRFKAQNVLILSSIIPILSIDLYLNPNPGIMRGLFFFFLFFAISGFSQFPDWNSFQQYDRVNNILELEQQLWIATDIGIFISDQSEYSIQHLTRSNYGLPSNSVLDLAFEETQEQMFIALEDIGIVYEENDIWQIIPYPDSLNNSGNPLLPFDIEFDRSGKLILGTNIGLLVYDNESWVKYNDETGYPYLLGAWDLTLEDSGSILVAGNILHRWDMDTLVQIGPDPDFSSPENIFAYGFSQTYQLGEEIWFFPDNGNIGWWKDSTWTAVTSPTVNGAPANVFTDIQGETWMLSFTLDFFRFDGLQWYEDIPVPAIDEEEIKSIYRFGENWYEFSDKDLRIHTSNDFFFHPLGEYPFAGSLFSLEEDENQNLWVREGGNQLLNIDAEQSRIVDVNGEAIFISKYTFHSNGKLCFVSGSKVYRETENGWEIFDATNSVLPESFFARELAVDSNGWIWLGIDEEGLFYFNGQEWNQHSFFLFNEFDFSDIEADASGGIWVSIWGANAGSLLFYISGSNYSQVLENYDFTSRVEFYLDNTTGDFWIHSREAIYNWENGQMIEQDLPSAIEGEELRQVIARENNLFVASRQHIFTYDGQIWQIFNKDNSPLFDKNISDIGLDKSGQLWILYAQTPNLLVYNTGFITSVEEQSSSSEKDFLIVYPTILEAELTIQLDLNQALENVQLRLTNLQGQVLHQKPMGTLKPGLHWFQLSRPDNLSSGWYILSLTGSHLQGVKRIYISE